VKRTSAPTPILVVLIAGLVCLLGAPRDANSGDTTKGILQAAGLGAVMGGACIAVAALGDESDTVEDGYARRGWLVGAGGSYVFETFEDEAESDFQWALEPRPTVSTVSFSADDSFGVNGRAGYRCHRRFSAEVELEWLDGFEGELFDSTLGKIATFEAEPWVFTFNTKGYLLTGRYQPFLLLGAGVMTADFETRDTQALGLADSFHQTNFVMRFGGGIDLYATKHVVVSVEADYVLPFGNLDPLDYLSIGLGFQYRF
jgi:opacity protein-like surface antigen